MSTAVTIIRPQGTGPLAFLAEAWQARHLLVTFALRDLRVRYVQAFFGVAWALIQPLALLAAFTLVLGRNDPLAYLVATLPALIPWQLAASGLGHGVNALVDQERLLTKVYFPRLVLPLAASVAGMLDALIVLVLAVPLLIVLGQGIGMQVLALPLLVVLTPFALLGPILGLAALNVRYRDVRYALPLLTQVLLIASPIAYRPEQIDAAWRLLLALNPLWAVMALWRWALLGTPCAIAEVALGAGVALVLLFIGITAFRRMERSFADVI